MAKKLTLASWMRAWFPGMPDSVRAEIDPGAIGLSEETSLSPGLDAAHIFVTERAELARLLGELRHTIQPAGQVWVSWPKKASKIPTEITEDVIRDICLPIGFVDVKVCAVDAVWSGLKLVIRKELR